MAIKGSEWFSAILPRDKMLKCFRQFQRPGLRIKIDKTGIFYYEDTLLPSNVIKTQFCLFKDPSEWSRTKNNCYWHLLIDKCSSLKSRHVYRSPAVPILPSSKVQPQ